MAKIRVAVVGGAGKRGRWYIGRLASHPEFELVAVVDRLVEAAELVARDTGIPGVAWYPDLADALDHHECDAVVVATQDAYHVGPTLTALERGMYVLTEKPLATTVRDCLTIVEADEKSGGKTMVGFNLRFAPFYRRMKELISDGSLGRLLTIQADEFYHGGRTYFRRWNRLKEFGGGLWITKASHDFDLLYWMADRLPESVDADAELSLFGPRPGAGLRCSECLIEHECIDSGLGVEQPALTDRIDDIRERNGWPFRDMCLYNSDKDTFDHGIARVRFPDGLLAVYTLSVVAPITDRRMRIGGTDAMIEGSVNSPEVMYYQRDRKELAGTPVPAVYEDTDSSASHGGGDSKLVDDFAKFASGVIPAPISPAQASVAVALGVAATESSEARHPVPMSSIPGWSEIAIRIGK